MKKYLNIKFIEKILTNKEILSGNFGLEKEGLRTDHEGHLALTPHPEVFGNKLTNPYITTDFSESQVEIVTPTFDNINSAYQCLSFLVDIVNTSINDDEYIWNHSLPCILPDDDLIPLAEYEGIKGEASRKYRIGLAEKYGTKKQMISGIHYNFSLNEDVIKKLYHATMKEESYKEFKNHIYMKISRNYLRLKWLIIYFTGCSVTAHKSFTGECIRLMDKTDNMDSFYSKYASSFRNSRIGYKNLEALYPCYDSVYTFTHDIRGYIRGGLLSEAKELYSQIRLKPKDPENYLVSLEDDGVNYVELRSIDINTFDKCGISKQDMEFVHLFLVYLLVRDEDDYADWQKESLVNEELVAEFAFKPSLELTRNGKPVSLSLWAEQILDEISQVNSRLNLGKEDLIDCYYEQIRNPDKTHAQEYLKLIERKGFINSQISFSEHNKETSAGLIDLETIKNNEELYEYYTKSLPKQEKI